MTMNQQNDANINFDDLDTGDTYDKAEAAKSGDFSEPVPDGKYQCIIERAWLAMNKAGDKRMLRWQLKIVGGNHGGRVLFRNNVIETPDNIKWLKGDLQVCGLTIHKLNELKDRVDSLIGVGVEVTVKNQGKDTQGRANQNVYLNKGIEIDRSAVGSSPAGGTTGGGGAATTGSGQFGDDEVPF